MATLFYNSKISISNRSVDLFEQMTSVWGRNCPTRRGRGSKKLTGFSSVISDYENHKNSLRSNKQLVEPPEAPTPAPVRPLYTSIMLMLTSLGLLKKTWTRSSKRSFRPQLPKKDYHSFVINSKPSTPTSIVKRLTWSIITSASNMRTFLPPL